MRDFKVAAAFGIGLLVASGATLAQSYGRGRNVQFVDGATISPTSVQASGTGDQFMCTATTAVCEVESNISAATMTSTVPAFDIGPTATPGANDRLACVSYGPSGSKTRMMCVDTEGDVNMTSLAVGTTPAGIRSHTVVEGSTSDVYAPTTFNEKHAVFGRIAASGATSGAVFLTYNSADNEGVIGSLSPTTAWRPLRFGGSEWKFQQAGNLVVANITSTGAYNSGAASGNQAFTCTNVGCRLSLGNTSRFIFDDSGNGVARFEGWGVSTSGNIFTQNGGVNATSGNPINVSGATADGATAVATILRSQNTFSTAGSKITSFRNNTSEVSFIDYLGNYSGNGFVATTASGSSLTGGGASGPLLLTSNATDAATSVTVPALKIRSTQVLTGTDKIFSIHRDTDAQLFSVDQNGNTWIGSDGATRTIWSRYFQSPSSPVEVGTWMSVGTEKAPIRITTFNTFTADDVAHVSVYNGATQTLTVSKDGLLRVNKGNAAKPTCNADNRGRIFFLDGASGAADVFEVCGKDATNAYSWKSIVTW